MSQESGVMHFTETIRRRRDRRGRSAVELLTDLQARALDQLSPEDLGRLAALRAELLFDARLDRPAPIPPRLGPLFRRRRLR